MTKTITVKEKERQEAIKELKRRIKPSDTILIIIKSVSQSGMSRRMQVLTKSFSNLTWDVGKLIDLPVNDKGILIKGCGMDMTFWLANTISYNLWNGKKLKSFKGNAGTCIYWKSL